MKTSNLALWTMGRSLVRVQDRTGAYKLPTGNPFPRFGPSGRLRAMHPSAVRAPAPAVQPNLLEEGGAPAAAAPAPAQRAPIPSRPMAAPAAAPAATPSYWRRAGSFAARLWTKMARLASWSGLTARLPGVFKLGARSPARDALPRAQGELALERVTVLRNDLSEADLVVVTPKNEAAQGSHAADSQTPGNCWARATARWIKLKDPAVEGDGGAPPERPVPLAELQP